ncbi:MAG TPA: hypothetical protein VHW00_16005 [Thermoanaerobaculia bacterium]|nr:hypothetical protein [Thermoanaerobaculia bacterium]
MKSLLAIVVLLFPFAAGAGEIAVTEREPGAASQFRPVTSVDAKGLLVAWRERDNIHIGGLTRDGARRPESVIHPASTSISDLDLQSSGDRSLLAWFEAGRVYAQRLDADGAPTGPTIDLGVGYGPSVAPAEDGFVLAWTDSKELDYVVTARISFEGIVAARQTLDPRDGHRIPVQEAPSLAAAQGNYLLAWNDSWIAYDWKVVVAPLDAEGRRLNTGTILSSDGWDLQTECGTASCVVAWFERAPDEVPEGADMPVPVELHAAVVTREGALLRNVRNLGKFLRGFEEIPLHIGSDEYGNFTLLVEKLKVELTATGEVKSSAPWTQHFVDLGGIERIGGTTYIVYSRDGRIQALKVAPKHRAVR